MPFGPRVAFFGSVIVLGGGIAACGSDPPPNPAPVFCKDGSRVPGAYPASQAVAKGQPVPNLSFQSDGPSVALADFFEPCAEKAPILLVRVGAPWCGTCDWHAKHTGELLDLSVGKRLRILDLLVSDEDNQPPTPAVATSYRGRVDRPTKIAIDPDTVFSPLNAPAGSLPLYVFIDAKTMKVIRAMPNPGPDLLRSRIEQELATLDGLPMPNITLEPLIEQYFSRDQWELLQAMKLPGAPPPDPSNAVADNAQAASLGRDLFSDLSLSPSGKVSCATCHIPEKNFTDGLAQGVGVAKVDRRTPPIGLSAHARSQFWDGRADSLWMQALGPIESEREMGSSRLFVAKHVFAKYKDRYETIFGPMPPLSDNVRFPANGKPGAVEWGGMTAADQEAVTRVFVSIGKSIAAFERTLRVQPTKFDAYVAGDRNALSDIEKHGVHEFFENGCVQCHHGPRMTDDAFHNLRFASGRQDGKADPGRSEGLAQLLGSEFRKSGAFSDANDSTADDARLLALAPKMLGRFKTPSLRGMGAGGPFGHGGTLATPEELAKHYGERGLPLDSPLAVGETENWVPLFSPHHQDLVSIFIKLMQTDQVK